MVKCIFSMSTLGYFQLRSVLDNFMRLYASSMLAYACLFPYNVFQILLGELSYDSKHLNAGVLITHSIKANGTCGICQQQFHSLYNRHRCQSSFADRRLLASVFSAFTKTPKRQRVLPWWPSANAINIVAACQLMGHEDH